MGLIDQAMGLGSSLSRASEASIRRKGVNPKTGAQRVEDPENVRATSTLNQTIANSHNKDRSRENTPMGDFYSNVLEKIENKTQYKGLVDFDIDFYAEEVDKNKDLSDEEKSKLINSYTKQNQIGDLLYLTNEGDTDEFENNIFEVIDRNKEVLQEKGFAKMQYAIQNSSVMSPGSNLTSRVNKHNYTAKKEMRKQYKKGNK